MFKPKRCLWLYKSHNRRNLTSLSLSPVQELICLQSLRFPLASTLLCLPPQFTRCITSQLIKWFSNFREFFYIQMEKFARHALMEGVADVRGLTVGRESELFRALNVHYNKANDFQVPDRFLDVAEITLREFYIAISLGKDRDPSWKKAIYKVICKLDSDVPADFQSHHTG